MNVDGVSFIPVQSYSNRAARLAERHKAKLAKHGKDYPPGLKEQYEMQPDVILPTLARPFICGIIVRAYFHRLLCELADPFYEYTVSADPEKNSAINPHYYEEEVDLDIMVEGLKFIRGVAKTKHFTKLVEEVVSEI
jgi:hypothetical protein